MDNIFSYTLYLYSLFTLIFSVNKCHFDFDTCTKFCMKMTYGEEGVNNNCDWAIFNVSVMEKRGKI
jgi:hypothetical protein